MRAYGGQGDAQARTSKGRRSPDAARLAEGRGAVGPARPDEPVSAALLFLQRAVGNAAVVRMVRNSGQIPAGSARAEDESGGAGPGPGPSDPSSGVRDALLSPWRPLSGRVREDMQARLGADFGDVRVHDGPAAARSAEQLGARAYTSGAHIVFGARPVDRHTLAHELVHVVQQRDGPVAGRAVAGGVAVSDPADAFERAADAQAARALRGVAVPSVRTPARARSRSVRRSAQRPGRAVQRTVVIKLGKDGKIINVVSSRPKAHPVAPGSSSGPDADPKEAASARSE